MLELEEFPDALKAFDKALEAEAVADGIIEADILTYRGIAKQKSGKNGYVKDIKDAAAKGGKRAKNLLKVIK
ncbi:MAG: hypothetical protein IPP49_01355 [Saprospiraceae bacterium]|nr:hypothetical protein [Saprospiraceae bacterium]